jgi:DNA primase
MDKADIEALKASQPILQVLAALGIAPINGRIRCPQPQNHAHGDRTPSVSIRADRNSFKCWVCPDVKGDVIDLVRLVKGCSFREALAFLGASQAALGSGPRPGPRPTAPLRASAPAAAATGAAPGTAHQASIFPPGAEIPIRSVGVTQAPMAAAPRAPAPSPADTAAEDRALREAVLAALLEACVPISGAAGRYLTKRRIFKRTWDGQALRMIGDYGGAGSALEARFGREALERAGFFNAAGHLRYYRHRLLFPYYDAAGKPVYMQARAIEADAKPKELSMSGPIPLPYNVRLLDQRPGQIYLCEGIIDTLTLIEQGFPAVGVPGAANFKPAWASLFRGKTVHVAFDPDAPGENGAARAIQLLGAEGIEARRFTPPRGLDLNDWFRKG